MKKLINTFKLDNAFQSNGEDTITFGARGLVITNGDEQRSGTKYDMKTYSIDEYDGTLTANHSDNIQEVIGQTSGVRKVGNKVVIDKIKFAVKRNALAQFAFDMINDGFLRNFSTETYSPWPDEDGVIKDAKLVNLSLIVIPNNKAASINNLEMVAANSIEKAKQQGLDTKTIEQLYLNNKSVQQNNPSKNDMTYVTVKNNRDFAVEVKYTNADGDECNLMLNKDQSVDVPEEQQETVEQQVKEAQAPKEEAKVENDMEKTLSKLFTPFQEKLDAMEQKMFDNSAKEPEYKKAPKGVKNASNELEAMDWKDRTSKQINFAWDSIKNRSNEAADQLKSINQFHMEKLQEAGKISNATTLADFGNFVIADELLTEIEGFRSNYNTLVSRFPFQETLSLTMAWLKRNGDIDMSEVEMCDDDADGNLKPISEYTADIQTSELHELAAVTPVCNAATRFLAADLLGDVAQGYRTDYDRKRAQLIIARLEQAIEANGNSATYDTTSDVNALKSWIDVLSTLAEETPDGVLIMNYKSAWQLVKRAIGSGISGDIKAIFQSGNLAPVLGAETILVPNDLLPTLNTAETKAFTVDGTVVTVNNAVFYVNPSNFKGRTSGGLMYDLSTEAAYEQGGSVKSAFQRNELVLRGSFFRGGAVLDEDLVSALSSPGVS